MGKGNPQFKKLINRWINNDLPMHVYEKTWVKECDDFVMHYLTDKSAYLPDIFDNSENSLKVNPHFSVSVGESHVDKRWRAKQLLPP